MRAGNLLPALGLSEVNRKAGTAWLRFGLGGQLQVELLSAIGGCGLGRLSLTGAGAIRIAVAAAPSSTASSDAGKRRQDQDQDNQ